MAGLGASAVQPGAGHCGQPSIPVSPPSRQHAPMSACLLARPPAHVSRRREPLSSPEVWEPFPWETDARRGASARLLQELDQRAQRSRADDARLLSQEPMNATN